MKNIVVIFSDFLIRWEQVFLCFKEYIFEPWIANISRAPYWNIFNRSNNKVSAAGIEVRTGRKRKECEAVNLASFSKRIKEGWSCRSIWMRQQGAWTQCEQVLTWKITLSELWKAQPHWIRFLIHSVYDTLPSPSNLPCLGIAVTPACSLYQRRGCPGTTSLSLAPQPGAEGNSECHQQRYSKQQAATTYKGNH